MNKNYDLEELDFSSFVEEHRRKEEAHHKKYPTDRDHKYGPLCMKYWARIESTEHKRVTNSVKLVLSILLIPVEIFGALTGGQHHHHHCY